MVIIFVLERNRYDCLIFWKRVIETNFPYHLVTMSRKFTLYEEDPFPNMGFMVGFIDYD
jgi:hypothetical protein